MKKPAVLTFDDEPLDLFKPRPSMVQIAKRLDELPDGKLKSRAQVEMLTDFASDTVWKFTTHPRSSRYIHKHGKILYYGNPRTILMLKAEIHAAQKQKENALAETGE